ncbi:testis-expressed protein 12 [Prinia subflava]|uniref:testis-expressed protein 12 n=1 Tax=Prinia subflava TaxID=208062 RepID=UPI002FDF423E
MKTHSKDLERISKEVAAPHAHCQPRLKGKPRVPPGRLGALRLWRDKKGINLVGYRIEAGPAIPPPSPAPLRGCLPREGAPLQRNQLQNEASENPQLSDKTDFAPSEDLQSLSKIGPLEKILNETSKEINNFLSKYADVIRARASLDSSYVQELDGILKEARAIHNHLKQKREKMKQRFAGIANSLQS